MNRILLRNASILTMTSEIMEERKDIIIENSMIFNIVPSNSSNDTYDQIIDCTNKYVIPGLIDAHMHILEDDGQELKLYVANGVTSIRNMWGNMTLFDSNPKFDVLSLTNKVHSGELLGPTIVNTSRLINDEPVLQKGSFIVSNTSEVMPLIETIKSDGYDQVKIYDNLKEEVFDEILKVSKALNIKVVGHKPISVSHKKIVNSSVFSVEHTLHIEKNTLADLIRNDIHVVPTLIAIKNYTELIEGNSAQFLQDENYKYANITANEGMWKPFAQMLPEMKSDKTSMFYKIKYASEKKKVSKFLKLGGELVAGTDYTNPYIYAGFSLHTELELMVDCGASNYQAIKAATINAAKCLEKSDDLGTIESGKFADIVILNENPLADIKNTRSIDCVILRGEVIDNASINKILKDVSESYSKKEEAIKKSEEAMLKEKTSSKFSKFEGVFKYALMKINLTAFSDYLQAKFMGQTIKYLPTDVGDKFVSESDSTAIIEFQYKKENIFGLKSQFMGKEYRFKKIS
jgi:imidazolonepropionase-like amidohydrolase